MLTKKQRIHNLIKRTILRVSRRKGQAYPVFIFGAQRSGTTMLVDVLDRSKQTLCYHENDEEAFDDYLLREDIVIARLIKESFAKSVVFKPICDSQDAIRVLNTNPESKGIWIYRKYQDVVNSSLRLWKEHYKYLHYMLYEPEIAGWRVENVLPEHIELVERYYSKKVSDASARALIWYLRNYQYFQQRLNLDKRVLLIGYERLVDDPVSQFGSVFDFAGLEYKEKFTRSIHGTSINKSPFPEIDPEIQALCDEMYKDLESIRTKGTPIRNQHERIHKLRD